MTLPCADTKALPMSGLVGAGSSKPRPTCAACLAALVAHCSAAVARAASPWNISAAAELGGDTITHACEF
eukprot:6172599-Pleurochrysis_carterae.AAC.5